MYIYLDKQGVVKEIINDEALRQSASNVNEIYVYYDGLQESDIGSVLATYGLPDGTILDETEVSKQTQESEIPYDAERDLKYFQYYKTYPFYHFVIADLALSQEGVVRLMLRLAQKDGECIKVAGLICFDVEGELVKEDHGVSLAQYNYLVKAWMDTKECLPLDGSKAMRADLDMGTHSVLLNGKALKGNNGALNYNGKDLANKEDVSSLQGDVASLKSDNTKNKADIASLKSGNTANKADISALKADNTKNKSDIVGLQTQVDTINATQNVVDIVGTKAELNAYSTKDLHANDKIEVLVDESQNDANTIYGWDGNAWSLVGSKAPYYSKAESDVRYNELKTKSYDKDATLDDLTQGHVPDSNVVKGISIDVKAHKQMIDTLGDEVIKSVKKDTDASLKSLTLPSAKDLKTKDGTTFGEDILDWSSKTIDDENGLVLTTEMLEELPKHSRMKVNTTFGVITFDYKFVALEDGTLSLVEGLALATGNSDDINGALYFVYLATGAQSALKFSGFPLPIGVKFDPSFNSITFSLSSTDDTEVFLKTINGQPIADTDKSTNIKVQDVLESGKNIKTINGNSILGEGDMPVQSKLYRHVITISNGNGVFFNGEVTISSGTEINTPELFIKEVGSRFVSLNGFGFALIGNKPFVMYTLEIRDTLLTSALYGVYTSDGSTDSQGNIHIFSELFGTTGITVADEVRNP